MQISEHWMLGEEGDQSLGLYNEHVDETGFERRLVHRWTTDRIENTKADNKQKAQQALEDAFEGNLPPHALDQDKRMEEQAAGLEKEVSSHIQLYFPIAAEHLKYLNCLQSMPVGIRVDMAVKDLHGPASVVPAFVYFHDANGKTMPEPRPPPRNGYIGFSLP